MAKLTTNVHAGGEWYGPDYGNADQVPDGAAAEITNPDVWEGGKLPKAAKAAADAAPTQPVDDSTPVDPTADDVDALRAEYHDATGKDADKRWGADRLRDEITAARGEG